MAATIGAMSVAIKKPETNTDLERCRARIAGTNIDPRSLLSTDYFNTFNSVIMLFGMLPEAPALLDEIDGWQFHDYIEHFKASGLDFGPLAIEVYPFAPESLRRQFEAKIREMRAYVGESRAALRKLVQDGRMDLFREMAKQMTRELQKMADAGAAIVHGHDATLDQSAIDTLF